MTVRLSTLGPQGPFSIKICERLLLSHAAWCVPTCLVRQSSGGCPAAAQLPWLCQTRRCSFSAISTKFCTGRGLCPRGKKDARSCVRSRRTQVPIFQEGVPRKRGSGGKPPMSARCAKALIEGGPQGIFGSFLGKQKGTRPAGRNSPPKHKKILNPS